MKTTELTGLWLAHWVALAEGLEPEHFSYEGAAWVRCRGDLTPYRPHEQWSQGGPIIERERIALVEMALGAGLAWYAFHDVYFDWNEGGILGKVQMTGPTPLIAAMRANVARVYGDEVPDPSPRSGSER